MEIQEIQTEGFSSEEVCKETGITYRQLDHWCRRGYVWPSVQDTLGSGSQRLFNKDDIEIIKRIVTFVNEGYTLKKAAELARSS